MIMNVLDYSLLGNYLLIFWGALPLFLRKVVVESLSPPTRKRTLDTPAQSKTGCLRLAVVAYLALGCSMTLWASTDFVVPPGPGDYPIGIVTGPDGNLWFANSNSRTIGRINPLDGTITRFPVPGAVYPFDIT